MVQVWLAPLPTRKRCYAVDVVCSLIVRPFCSRCKEIALLGDGSKLSLVNSTALSRCILVCGVWHRCDEVKSSVSG
jgi:hypothetical protein